MELSLLGSKVFSADRRDFSENELGRPQLLP